MKDHHVTRKDKRGERKKKKIIGMGPVPLGAVKEASLAGRSAGTDRELQRLRGKCSRLAVGIIETDQHRLSWPPHYTPQPKTRVCWYTWGLGSKTQGSADRPGERNGVGCAEKA